MMQDQGPVIAIRRVLLGAILLLCGTVYGFFATANGWWIADRIAAIRDDFRLVAEGMGEQWFYTLPRFGDRIEMADRSALAPGLVMIAFAAPDRTYRVQVIDRAGSVHHEWTLDWFDIWPEPSPDMPEGRAPAARPGTMVHGASLLPEGDLVFNFEGLSTVRVSPCGDVVWALDNLGHHSVDIAGDGTIWVGAEDFYHGRGVPWDNHVWPYSSWTAQQLDADGKVLRTISINDVLVRNGLDGLLYLSNLDNDKPTARGDTLHLNDVEIFPDRPSDLFEPGDILVSLRNINTVLVFDPEDLRVKFLSTGQVIRQHDADFGPDDTIVIYDNRNLEPFTAPERKYSRIVTLDARDGSVRHVMTGRDKASFNSPTMGRQQQLANGNFLVLSPLEGRAFETTADGAYLWAYNNVISDKNSGLMSEAELLPQEFDEAFFERLGNTCKQQAGS